MGAVRCCDQPLVFRPTFEIASASFDPELLGVGASPYAGDASSTFLPVPATPTPDQQSRYLFRLCVLPVSSAQVAIVRGVRTYIDLIGTLEGSTYPFSVPVKDPNWKFTDGNVSWHLRRLDPGFQDFTVDPNQVAGTSPRVSGSDSALLYTQLAAPYIPPGAGIPPGTAVDFLGTWRDMRYPWTAANWDMLRVPVPGPCTLVLYASVHQTNPETRPTPPDPDIPGSTALCDTSIIVVEDQFVSSFPDARYGHVGGALLIELAPGVQL